MARPPPRGRAVRDEIVATRSPIGRPRGVGSASAPAQCRGRHERRAVRSVRRNLHEEVRMNVLALLQDAPAMPAGAAEGGSSIAGQLVGLVIAVLVLASTWKLFAKAGEPGWAAIVPIYNLVI